MNNLIEYNIFKSVYDCIISGEKTIEYRLLNDKSRKIKKGDIINFKVVGSTDELQVEVIEKYIYNDVDELWLHPEVLTNSLNYNKEEFRNELYKIFGKEKVLSSKIVGIKFKCLERQGD